MYIFISTIISLHQTTSICRTLESIISVSLMRKDKGGVLCRLYEKFDRFAKMSLWLSCFCVPRTKDLIIDSNNKSKLSGYTRSTEEVLKYI